MVKKIPKTSKEEKRKNVISKLIFISLMGALVGIVYLIGNIQADKGKESEADTLRNKGMVIGEETSIEAEELKSALAKQVDQLKNTATYYQGEIETTAEKTLQQGKKELESRVSEAVYQTTIKPLIDKVQSLPETQQEYIKEELCR